jgi:deazaflavin-dependent oxidoreductase (nitroreductase family)
MSTSADRARYLRPNRWNSRLVEPAMRWLARRGIGPMGMRILVVPGRRSGEPRQTPVNPLTIGDRRYLVAPRGQTQWVRNVRAAGGGELRLGRRVERFTVTELDDAAKPTVLRAYLRRWWFEVSAFFDGVGPRSAESEFARIAADHPVFLLHVSR